VTRSPEQRKSDALAKLTANKVNVWFASASPTGAVHIAPVPETWSGSQVVLATGPRSRTVGRPGIPLIVVAATLSFVSGVMDITSFTRLGMVFSSVMTGNLVLFGLAAERASGGLALHAAVAIASYIFGVALGGLVFRDAGSREVLWPRKVTAALALELLAVTGFTIAWELVNGRPTGNSQFLLLTLAALAMGLQSEAMRNVGTTLSTTYLTGTITSTVASFVTGARHARENRLNLAILGSVTLGAAAAGGLISVVPVALPVLPMVSLIAIVVVARTVGVHE
jgi:uncharacterized membrane protein YoaK (UPF0700 family)